MAIAKEVTFEGLKYTLDNQDRLAAEVAHQSAGNQVPVESITGAGGTKVLTMADSGKLFVLDTTADTQAFTLPTVGVGAGFHAKFIWSAASDNDVTWTSGADNIIMSCTDFTASGAAQVHTTDTVTTARANLDGTPNSSVGDTVEIFCDGTNYFFKGFSNTQHASSVWATS